MSTQPIDYDALAKQAGATSSIDYDALAKQAGAISSTHPAPKVTPTPTGTISNAPTGFLPWLNSVENDIRFGGQQTAPGKVLHFLGAPGINRGVPEETANQIAGPLIGPVTTAQGAATIPQHPLAGILGMAKGLGETGFQAGGFVAPEVGDAAAAVPAKVAGMIPSAERAGKNFQEVMGAAKSIPIDVTDPGNTALQIYKLSKSGGTLPKVVRDFLNRVSAPDSAPLTYEEARDFASNAGKLSADEANRLTPKLKRLVGQFANDLGQANADAADQAGKLQQYQEAMKEYRQASQLNKVKTQAKQLATKAAISGVLGAGGAAGAALGYDAYKAMK